MEEKKKRGWNYTEAEKEMFLELIKKYQNIIENRETNAHMIVKKREAWDSVCQQYNAFAVSGSRTRQQLRRLYENLKQKSKKNMALENRLHFHENVKEIDKKTSLDKKEINRTGGGAYKSTITEQDAQVLALVAPQVQPLSNPYDDAALYFDDIKGTERTEFEGPEVITKDDIVHQEATVATTYQKYNQPQMSPSAATSIDQEYTQPQTSSSALTKHVKPKENEPTQQYFKQKLRNAKLEHKYLRNKNRMELNKYKIEIQILKLRLQKLKSPCKH